MRKPIEQRIKPDTEIINKKFVEIQVLISKALNTQSKGLFYMEGMHDLALEIQEILER